MAIMTDGNIKILIVEHDEADIEFIQRELKKCRINFSSKIVDNATDFEDALINFAPDIILSDYNLPRFSGLTAFAIKERISPDIPFIIVSGFIGEENAIEIIKSGVTDYVLKDRISSLPIKKIGRAHV